MVAVSQQPELCPVYLMTVRLGVEDDRKSGIIDFDTEIIGMNSPPIPRQDVGLLGRDCLRGLHVNYNGPKGRVELHVSSEITGSASARKPKKRKKKR